MRRAMSFVEWLAREAEREIGVETLVTYKILQAKTEIRSVITRLLSDDLARLLADEGLRLTGKGELFSGEDFALQARKINVVLGTLNGELPIEYVNFVFTHWEKEYQARLGLQNRSVWDILKWVIRRSWLKWHNNYNPEAFYGR